MKHNVHPGVLLAALWIALAGCATAPPTPAPTATPAATATVTPTLPPVPSPALPDCPGGRVSFSSYSEDVKKGTNYVSCPDGTSLTEIVLDYRQSDPRVSPQGELVLRIADDHHALILEDPSGQEVKRLIDDPSVTLFNASWSFDGNYVAYDFVDERSFSYGLEIVHVETNTVSTLFAPDSSQDISVFAVNWIRWSPCSYKLLIYGGTVPTQVLDIKCSRDSHSCSMQVQGQPGKFTDTYTANPWSRDGTRVAYLCYTSTKTDDEIVTTHALCIQDVFGEMLHEFQEDDLGISSITSLCWSPDGTRLAFAAYFEGTSSSDIFILSPSDGTLFNLTAGLLGNQDYPLWLP
jgi:hypothetical protein